MMFRICKWIGVLLAVCLVACSPPSSSFQDEVDLMDTAGRMDRPAHPVGDFVYDVGLAEASGPPWIAYDKTVEDGANDWRTCPAPFAAHISALASLQPGSFEVVSVQVPNADDGAALSLLRASYRFSDGRPGWFSFLASRDTCRILATAASDSAVSLRMMAGEPLTNRGFVFALVRDRDIQLEAWYNPETGQTLAHRTSSGTVFEIVGATPDQLDCFQNTNDPEPRKLTDHCSLDGVSFRATGAPSILLLMPPDYGSNEEADLLMSLAPETGLPDFSIDQVWLYTPPMYR